MHWTEKVQKRIDEMGWSDARFEREAGLSKYQWREYRDRKADPSVSRAILIARASKFSVAELFEGVDAVKLYVTVDGITRGGGMWADVVQSKKRIVPLKLITEESVFIEVSDTVDAGQLGFRRGDVIGGNKVDGKALDNLLGAECIIETVRDGRRLGILHRGTTQGRYNIRPFDLHAKGLDNVEIEWAAAIEIILRGMN